MAKPTPVQRTDAQWRQQLDEDQYRVLRESGTEPAFCGVLIQEKREGTYHCGACDAPLFVSNAKFDSGSGWPSFFDALDEDLVTLITDHSHGMVRTEARCAACDSHLGHVFPDGPPPSGNRYCVNSISLQFKPASV